MSKVDLGIRYSPEFQGTPSHISREDFEIWKRFRLHPIVKSAQAVYFDVGLGGQEVESGAGEAIDRAWRRLTAKRADVVLEYPDQWIIVELRFAATASALGRLLLYRDLWLKDPPDNRQVKTLLVTDRLDPDVARVATSFGIEALEV